LSRKTMTPGTCRYPCFLGQVWTAEDIPVNFLASEFLSCISPGFIL
jgi:hypothetical protein